MACYSCGGTGKERCIYCGGSGQKVHTSAIPGMLNAWRGKCYDCSGTGEMTCRSCGGRSAKQNSISRNSCSQSDVISDSLLSLCVSQLIQHSKTRFDSIKGKALTDRSNGSCLYETSFLPDKCFDMGIWESNNGIIHYFCRFTPYSDDQYIASSLINNKCNAIESGIPNSWKIEKDPFAEVLIGNLIATSPDEKYSCTAELTRYTDQSFAGTLYVKVNEH